MYILGVADGLDAGAALVEDDHIVAVASQARIDRTPKSRAFPWDAISQVLEIGGISRDQVDVIAVAGRFTPPLALRREPRLRRVAADPFSPVIDAAVFYQAVLRETGFGALDADRAAEWLEGRFSERGLTPSRVVLIDIHAALAHGALRTQETEPITVFTLHPMGDGKSGSVFHSAAGHLDRLWEQRGFAALHVHLQRCAAAMRLRGPLDNERLWTLAGRGRPDPALMQLLYGELHAEGDRLSRRSFPLPTTRRDRVYRALSGSDPFTAAASVLANLERAVLAWVGHHIAARPGPVALAGAIFDNPRLTAAVASLEDVERVWVPPNPGYGLLSLGAALSQAGCAPRSLTRDVLATPDDARVREVLPEARPVDDAALARVIADAGVVGNYQSRSGVEGRGGGYRSVLARADRPSAVAAARAALGRASDEEPVLVLRESAMGHAPPSVGPCLGWGTVAPIWPDLAQRFPGVATPDQRVRVRLVSPGEPLDSLLERLQECTGCGGVAAFSLGLGEEPPATSVEDAARVWQSGDLDVLRIGSLGVSRTPLVTT